MILCNKCDKQAKWRHPIEGYFMCPDCALEELKQLQKEGKASPDDDLGDVFMFVTSFDPEVMELNESTGAIYVKEIKV